MAHLIVVEGPSQGATYPIDKHETIGSEQPCSIVLKDRRVAPRHAELRKRKNGSIEIRNIEPHKHILVNGEIVRTVMLQHGDWITISDTTLVFSEDSDPSDNPDLEFESIDADDLMESTIHTRRQAFEDAESVIESIDQSGDGHDNRLQTLYRVTHELCQIIDLRQLIDRLAAICIELFPADRAIIFVMDEDNGKLKPMANRHRFNQYPSSADYSRTIIKEVFRTKEAVLSVNAMDDDRFLSGQSIVDQNLRSFMCVPLLHQNNITGMIQINSTEEGGALLEEDLEMLSAIAMQVGVLIENCKAYKKRQEFNQILFHLGRATQQLSSFLQKDRILKEAVKIGCKILNCTKASVMLLTDNANLRLASVQGMTPEVWSKIDKRQLGNRFVRKVIEDGKPWLISDIRKLGITPRPRYLSHSLLIVPIISSLNDGAQEPIGAISVTDKVGGGIFSGNDQKILSILAGQVAITLKNAELYEKATVDSLTKVYVRRFFELKLEEEMALAQTKKRALSMLMLDIDHFKRVNDNYTHSGGDAVLRSFATLLKKCVRPSDVVARWGGEEFAVILSTADETRASRVAERIRQAVENSEFRLHDERMIRITASMGIATYQPGETADGLLLRADTALYAAKNNGRNQHQLWRPGMKQNPATVSDTKSHDGR